MRRKLVTIHYLLIALFLISCQPTQATPLQSTLFIYRFDSPAFIEYSANYQRLKELPFSLPPHCELLNTFAPPVGKFMALESDCPNGQTVLFLDSDSAST